MENRILMDVASLEGSNLLRKEDKCKIAITAFGLSFGNLAIDSQEKAKTIKRHGLPVDPEREYQHIKERLGVESTSVPDLGETPITNAAMAVIKLALFNGVDLGSITEVDLATESARELSKNRTLEIIKIVNEASAVLDKHGIHIGKLRERGDGNGRKAVHTNQHQSACDSAGQELYEDAKDGMNPNSKKLLIASDYASYRKGRPEDETGGFGAVAMVIEPAVTARGGIFLSSEFLGEANMDSMEFLKNAIYELGNGISLINTDPIVFGGHSNFTYHFLAFEALIAAFSSEKEHINTIKDVTKYDISWHIPFPNMPQDSAGYFVRHLARRNPRMTEEIKMEVGEVEPLLPNFKRLEREFEFIHDIGETYLPFGRIKEEISRLSEPTNKEDEAQLSETTRKELVSKYIGALEKSLPQQAKLSAMAMRGVKEKYKSELDERISEAIESAASNLLEASKKPSLSIENIDAAIAGLVTLIDTFVKKDTAYNTSLRKTLSHRELVEDTHMREATLFSKEIGNIDTASAPLSIASLIANTDNDKNIMMGWYGSTSSFIWLMGEKRNISEMKAAIAANWDFEINRRHYITGEEYLRLEQKRRIAVVANENLPIFSSTFYGTNEESLLQQARSIIEYSRSYGANRTLDTTKAKLRDMS
ncbi:MAG: hypothetical protein QXK65_01335 [Candidatus Micrarchaeaceae archaeon]